MPQPEQVWAWPPGPGTGGPQAVQAWAWPPPVQPRRTGGSLARPRPGTAYHRMARTWRYRWWVPLVAIGVAVGLIIVVQLVMGMAAVILALVNGYEATGDSFFGALLPDLAFQLIVITTMTPLVMLVAWLVQRRPVGTLFSVTGRLRWRWMLGCAAIAIIPMVLSFAFLAGLLRATTPGTPFLGAFGGGPDFVGALLIILLLVPFQASAEEIALRGFLMQSVGSLGAPADDPRGGSVVSRFLRSPVLGILISGTVFTFLHAYVGWGLLDVAVFGIAMAWLTWYTGGLEAAIGLHVVHNLAAFGLTAYEGGLADVGTGGGSWQGVVATTVEVILYCLVVAWLARKVGLQRTVPDDPAAAAGQGYRPAPQAWAAGPRQGTTGASAYHDPYRAPATPRFRQEPPAGGPPAPPA
ncbi:CPBP family intramembrane glutamic endopeptidase [Nocardiopsis mangrovi]|uniref:CPBP family intramembrane glutamic endopeptidase n=1 Tax=Nocardiopsis mangrovi TaxID=1179818 RepID=A0ABV9DP95_9ACTN